MVNWSEYREFEELNDKYLPDRGEGDNMATQAVTAINKLVYKWYNDGDVYDNTAYLEGWWNDLSSYANWLHKYLEIKELEEIFWIESHGEYEDILWKVANIVLDESFLKEYEEVPCKGSIYECEGVFQFVEIDEDEDEWY